MDWEKLVEPWWLEKSDELNRIFSGSVGSDFLSLYDFSEFGLISKVASDDKYVDVLEHFGSIPHPSWADPGEATLVVQSSHVLDAVLGRSDLDSLEERRFCVPVDLSSVDTMARWGGGFGLQIWLQRRLGCRATEYIVDLPVMSKLQHAFLSHNLESEVHLYDGHFIDGAVNLVPLPHVEEVPSVDVFCALHTLDESSEVAQRYVVEDRRFFDAEKLLLAWTPSHAYFRGSEHWSELVERFI